MDFHLIADEDFSALIAGAYQITGSDNNGCLLPNTTIDVTEPNAMDITLVFYTNRL